MGIEPVPQDQITLDEMANVESLTLNNYLVHVGNHPHYGDIAASQWAGENFATLDIRHPGPTLGFRPPARYN